MNFSDFIEANLDALVAEWGAFARTLVPAAASMSDLALRNHSREILLAIVQDMRTSQTETERISEGAQTELAPSASRSIAAAHGALRLAAGIDLAQLVSEFRALRGIVLALWRRTEKGRSDVVAIEDITRFNDAIDQALGESILRYSDGVAASKDMFLAVLAHDLRSPLHGIELASHALAQAALADEKRLKIALRLKRSSREMDRLVTDLLEFTRSRLGRGIPVQRSACDLGEVCEEALDAVRASDPEHAFGMHRSGDLLIHVDRQRLLQVLSNLLNNAAQHGDRNAPVSLNARGDAEAIVLEIANDGMPIPPDAMATIFEPLIQIPAAMSDPSRRSRTSLGLGLFIVREIVRGHAGTIDVHSSADAGTVFTIRLPRAHVGP